MYTFSCNGHSILTCYVASGVLHNLFSKQKTNFAKSEHQLGKNFAKCIFLEAFVGNCTYLTFKPTKGSLQKKISGESWDIVPTPLGPSPPYQGWDAYQKIKNILLLYCVF